MKRLIATLATVLVAAPAMAEVGVSIDVGQPGFYGHIDIGDYPPPRVIYNEPVIIERGPAIGAPVYLRVPPGHAKHWAKHCHEYHACGERVYFVQDDWYTREYVPRYQERHRDYHRYDNDHYDNDRHDSDRHDDHRDYDDHDRGHGNGNGNGNGRGHDH